MNLKHRFFIGICIIAFFACKNNCYYSNYHNLPINGWHADSLLNYSFEISDTINTYDVLFYVRNTTAYPYQNMWLFVTTQTPDGNLQNDTIEFYLANQRGQWLGNGVGSIKEMPVLYRQATQFPQSGNYIYRIQQGMREEFLVGINDIGVKIIKN